MRSRLACTLLLASLVTAGCGLGLRPPVVVPDADTVDADASVEVDAAHDTNDAAPFDAPSTAIDASPDALDAPDAPDAFAALDAPADVAVPDGAAPDAVSVVEASVDASAPACRSDRDCSSLGLVCASELHVCVECAADVDCGTGRICVRHACRSASPCTSSRMCPGQVCDATRGVCVDCVVDDDCPVGDACADDHLCDRQACLPNSVRCSADGRLATCDARGRALVLSACGVSESCSAGRCVPWACTPDSTSCASTTSLHVCAHDGLTARDEPCGADTSCRNGACIARACTAGSRTCTTSVSVGVCTADGLDATVTPCPTYANTTGPRCTGTACTAPCDATHGDCNGIVTDGCETSTTSDPGNCGACNNVCALPYATTACVNALCTVATCGARRGDCDHVATNGCERDLAADAVNCGACNNACPAPAHAAPGCSSGVCGVGPCDSGWGNCDGVASNGCETDITTAANNCGSCGTVCPAGSNGAAACVSGACSLGPCSSGFANCDGIASNGCETNLSTNASRCGTCTRACPTPAHGAPICAGGACGLGLCEPGYVDCNADGNDGCEIDVRTSLRNCGSCAHVCPAPAHATASCTAGVCAVGACMAPYADCNGSSADGCETDTSTNAMNCGTCAHACASGVHSAASCVNSACTALSCTSGYADCNGTSSDGCEADLNSSATCGACGTSCGSLACASAFSVPGNATAAGWSTVGSTAYDATSGTIVLTPDAAFSQAGLFVRTVAAAPGDITVTFDFRIARTGASGIAFFLSSSAATQVGGGGTAGFGIAGLSGYAVEFDTYQDSAACAESNANHIGVDALVACGTAGMLAPTSIDATPSSVTLADNTWHAARVVIASGRATAGIDGTTVIGPDTLIGFNAATQFHLGFAASDSGVAVRQEIRNVSVNFGALGCR